MAESKKKNCPLTYSVQRGAYDQQLSDFDYCIENECAWWDDDEKACAIFMISKFMGLIWSMGLPKKGEK